MMYPCVFSMLCPIIVRKPYEFQHYDLPRFVFNWFSYYFCTLKEQIIRLECLKKNIRFFLFKSCQPYDLLLERTKIVRKPIENEPGQIIMLKFVLFSDDSWTKHTTYARIHRKVKIAVYFVNCLCISALRSPEQIIKLELVYTL